VDLDSLLAQYRTDPTRLDQLLEAATRYATSIARREGHHDPEDIGQRVAIKLWEGHRSITSSCRWWLAQTTKRMIIDDARQRQRLDEKREAIELDAFDPTVPRDWEGLPADLRELAAMLALGYSADDICDRLRFSRRTLQRKVEAALASRNANNDAGVPSLGPSQRLMQ
jgi:DNA-directed RNA polymerase specialized sigma24 family protein